MLHLANQEPYLLRLGEDWNIQSSCLARCLIEEMLKKQEERVKRPLKIFEYGSGVSTIWYGLHYPSYEIYALEGDKEWYGMVSGWLKEHNIKNVHHIFHEQTGNWRGPETINPNYLKAIEEAPFPYDAIFNDGCLREMVGDNIIANADKYLAVGGYYFRHDYENLINGNWLGLHLDPNLDASVGHLYDKFTSEHPNYEFLTINGDGKWGFKCEYGGFWRKS